MVYTFLTQVSTQKKKCLAVYHDNQPKVTLYLSELKALQLLFVVVAVRVLLAVDSVHIYTTN